MVFSNYFLSLLNSCSVCVASIQIFENAAKDFRFKLEWTRTIDYLKQSIQQKQNQISEETCQKVCHSAIKRCLNCIKVQGRNFKQL